MAAASLMLLEPLLAANEENLATPPFSQMTARRRDDGGETAARRLKSRGQLEPFDYFRRGSSSSSFLQQLLRGAENQEDPGGTGVPQTHSFTVGAAAALMWISELAVRGCWMNHVFFFYFSFLPHFFSSVSQLHIGS